MGRFRGELADGITERSQLTRVSPVAPPASSIDVGCVELAGRQGGCFPFCAGERWHTSDNCRPDSGVPALAFRFVGAVPRMWRAGHTLQVLPQRYGTRVGIVWPKASSHRSLGQCHHCPTHLFSTRNQCSDTNVAKECLSRSDISPVAVGLQPLSLPNTWSAEALFCIGSKGLAAASYFVN